MVATVTTTFSLTVDPVPPLVINNDTEQLTNGQLGVPYETGLLPLGGVPSWRWSLVSGALPPGLSVETSPGRVKGTPMTTGAFTFTVCLDDSAGSFATGQFTVMVAP